MNIERATTSVPTGFAKLERRVLGCWQPCVKIWTDRGEGGREGEDGRERLSNIVSILRYSTVYIPLHFPVSLTNKPPLSLKSAISNLCHLLAHTNQLLKFCGTPKTFVATLTTK